MSHPDLALAESVSTTNASYFICVYILILIYCCFGLAVVCDVYFVPALQKLSHTYDLPPDIAGSTLMALGASVPELFASLIGVFITKDDIGTGSIIGSSCFNLIAVPAACAFVAAATFNRKLTINPMPVIRNSAFYAVTILVLLLTIKDNKVDILEAIILLLFFVMYMGFMIFSARSSGHSDSLQSSLTSSYISSSDSECKSSEKVDNGRQNQQEQQQQQALYGQFYFSTKVSSGDNNIIIKNPVNERTPLVSAAAAQAAKAAREAKTAQALAKSTQIMMPQYQQQSNTIAAPASGINDPVSVRLNLGGEFKDPNCLVNNIVDDRFGGCEKNVPIEENWVSSKWILVPMLPLTLSMKILTPCKFKNTCWTIWTFIVSIALIGGLTYVSVGMVHLFGQTVGIPETVAGMTILSWGTGIPELIASIVLIKKTAQADMALCNTIGSNVIDISFCLSVPWIVKCLINKSEGLKPRVEIQSEALPWTSFTLFVAVILLILILKWHHWELSFSVGAYLTAVYITFVIVATKLEYSFSDGGLDLMSLL